MNGAAVNCQQEQALLPKPNDSSSLHSHGFLQTNYSCQENISQHQYSKEMNYKLLPDNFSVDDSSKYSQYIDSYSSETRNRLSYSGDVWDNRINPTRIVREPMELPVPKFEIDENSVGVFTYKKEKSISLQDPKDLDLDTRIDLLIKSKALSGMHPIFSDLNESENSSTDSEESFSDLSKHQPLRHGKVSTPEKHVIRKESFDDPEKPLSRPPSPFLSRATYLFWFNKAIELKQQAKAQEQALLEKATKKLNQGNLSSGYVSKTDNTKQDNNLLNCLLSEVSKELKESIKQDFIQEIIENTLLNSLDDWWVNEKKLEEGNRSKDFSKVCSSTNKKLQSKETTETNESSKFQAKSYIEVCKDQTLTSPEVLFPTGENKNHDSEEKLNILTNQVTSMIELNKTQVEDPDTVVLEEMIAGHKSVLCKENDDSSTKRSLDDNSLVDESSFIASKPLILEETRSINSINDKVDIPDVKHSPTSVSNDQMFKEKSNVNLLLDVKTVLHVPINSKEMDNHQQNSMIENLPIPEKSVVISPKENILVEMEHAESSKNSGIATVKALDTIKNLEENEHSSKDLSVEKDKNEELFLQDNKENNAETKQYENF